MVWLRGKPMEVRMATLSSGGELSNGVAVAAAAAAKGSVSLAEEGSSSIVEDGRLSGSAKSGEEQDGG